MITMKNEMLLVQDIDIPKLKMVGGIILPDSSKVELIIRAIVYSTYNETLYPVGSIVVYEAGYNKKYIDILTKEHYKIINSKNVLAIIGE